MEREEIEQVERELDAILEIVQESAKTGKTAGTKEEGMTDETNEVTPGEAAERPKEDELDPARMEESAGQVEEPREQWEGDRQRVRILRPSDCYLAAFFVPIMVMIVLFAQRGIFPFGEESFLRTDMYHQYAPFFSEFQYKLTHGGSLLYSWDIGMGVNFSALYAYYLASPLNWLILLCPKGFLIEFMTLMIVLKTGLAGLSFAWYLCRHCGRTSFGAGLFAVFYALSGYMAAYSWNIMWLDCIVLLPLILLGLERLAQGGYGLLYGISLGLSILSNYYISIMICIFMVIYLAAQLILNPPRGPLALLRIGLKFALYSLLAGGIAAVVLLPEIYALQATASGEFDFPNTVTCYFSIFDMIARHLGNVQTETGLDHWPNIYCGVAVLALFLLYLGDKRIRPREKVVYCGLLLLFYASFSINVLNFIWHGFHYPNSLPCRQSFLYIALMLVMCYRAYCNMEETPWKHVALAFWGAMGFVLLAQQLVEDQSEQFHFSVFYAAIVFLAVYMGLLYLYKTKRWSMDALLLTALAVVAVESAVNLAVTSIPTTSRTEYTSDNEDIEKLTWGIQDDTFYRVEREEGRRTKNDGAWMNFPTASLFSSTADAALSEFFRALGCESSTNAYSITGSTPLADSLFSVKYDLYTDQQPDTGLHELAGRSGEEWMYRNTNTLPVAFMLPQDVETNWMTDSGNPANVQNDLSRVLGVQDVLIWNDNVAEGGGLSFTAEETGDYYAYVINKNVKDVTVSVGESSQTFHNVDRGYFLELGWLLEGQEVTMDSTTEGKPSMQAEIWRFNPEGMREVYQEMNRNPIALTRWTDTLLEGTIQADQAGAMYTSIPYDKGWTLWVDGVKTETRTVFDTFLAADLTAGAHSIRLSYQPQGLRTGACLTAVSAAGIALLAAGCFWNERRKRGNKS